MCDLRVFANLREDLIVKQKALYDLAGLAEEHFTLVKSSAPLPQDEDMVPEEEAEEPTQDYDWQFEAIEDAPMFEDEEIGDEFTSEDTAKAEDEQFEDVIKIEKIEQKDSEGTLEAGEFDYEEILAYESEGDEVTMAEEEEDEKFELIEEKYEPNGEL